jgi:putative nucleotidyltransferase with HDIG domain
MPESEYANLIQFTKALSVALKERDEYTRLHSKRVMNLSVELGERLGLDFKELILLKTAAALHDIGKIGMPDSVLLKPDRLDPDEKAIMQLHSERGANIVLTLEQDGVDEISAAIRHHHENFDGKGYPDCLVGEEIPIFARIITIADNYDAMATRRVYQAAKSHSEIIDILFEEKAYKHDPSIFDIFIQVIEQSENRAI